MAQLFGTTPGRGATPHQRSGDRPERSPTGRHRRRPRRRPSRCPPPPSRHRRPATPPLDADAPVALIAGERQLVGATDCLQAGRRTSALRQLAIERSRAPGVVVLGSRQRQLHGDDATSFGLRNPTVENPRSYDDFVDFSHCKLVSHDCFCLSYPTTWFLRLQGTRHDRDTNVQDDHASAGGVTCSSSLSVSVRHGSRRQLAEIRSENLARLSSPIQGPMGMLVPQRTLGSATRVHESSYLLRLENPAIDGIAYGSMVLDPSGLALAQVDTFGCVSKANPRRAATLQEMSQILPAVVDSFRFLSKEA